MKELELAVIIRIFAALYLGLCRFRHQDDLGITLNAAVLNRAVPQMLISLVCT